jgi:hypothetical protein
MTEAPLRASAVNWRGWIMSEAKKALVSERIAPQKKWIEEHGGDLQGYLNHYGEKSRVSEKEIADIYRADLEILAELEALMQ